MTSTPRVTLLDRLLGARRRASATTLIDVHAVTPGQAVWTERSIEKLLSEGYEHAVWVYAAMNAILRVAKQTRWLAYRDDQELDDHGILRLLRRPNPEQSGRTFTEALIGYYLGAGNTYIERVGLENGPPLELWIKRPDRMRIVPSSGGDGRIAAYEYRAGGRTFRFEPWQIRHVKTWAPLDDWYGMSPIAAAARGIDLFNVGQAANLALMQNGARPSGAFVSTTALTDEQHARLKAELRDNLTGAARGMPLLLEGGMSWTELGITPRDLDWLAGQTDAARQAHAAFGVHPVLTGLESGTFENQRLAQRALLTNVVLPILDQVQDELNAWLAPAYPDRDLRIGYDRDAFPALAEDEGALWDRALRGYTQGVLKRNEARVMLGYGEVTDGDEFKSTFGGLGLLNAPTPPGRREAGPGRLRAIDPGVYAAGRLALQLRWEAALTAWWRETLDDQRQALTDRMRGAGTSEELTAIADTITMDTGELVDSTSAWYLAAAYAGGRHAADAHGFEAAKSAPPARRATPPATDPLLELMQELWGILFGEALTKAREHAIKVVGEISETTRLSLRELIRDGIEAGRSITDIAETIDALYLEQIIPNRSTVIARTETISSTNYGGQQAARATGLTLAKTWLATTTDDRTRPAHLEADGQTRALDEPYIVDGEALMYPGDPDGSAGNVIQCRCSETYREVTA